MFHEDYVHETTNYRKRTLVPINTPVVFARTLTSIVGARGEQTSMMMKPEIIVKLPDGKELRIANIKKFSGEDWDGIFARTLGREKVDLSSFTALEMTNILKGTLEPGMSKAAVLRAMGYAPKHETPGLERDQWRFWQNRMSSFLVNFKDGKVSNTQK